MLHSVTDAFLNQLHRGTSQLRDLVDQINEFIETHVQSNINNIQDMIFFDYKLAFTKSWVSS